MDLIRKWSGQPDQRDERRVSVPVSNQNNVNPHRLQKQYYRKDTIARSDNSAHATRSQIDERTEQETSVQAGRSENVPRGSQPVGTVAASSTDTPLPSGQGNSGLFKPHSQESYDAAAWQQYVQDLKDRYKGIISDREREIEQLKGTIDKLTAKNGKLRTENNQLGEDIQSLQKSSFNLLGDSGWVPLDPGKIEQEIESIRTEMRGFAKRYAAETSIDIEQLSEEIQRRARKDLQMFVHFGSEGPKALQDLFQTRHAARMCLEALISNEIHRRIFCDPFFFTDNKLWKTFAGSLRDQPDVGKGLHSLELLSEIYRDGEEYDKTKANIWRSDTLRLMNPQPFLENPSAKARIQRTELAINQVCKDIAHSFDPGVCGFLLKPLEPRRFVEDLADIFVKAGQLSIRLWTQRPSLECLFMSDLCEERYSFTSEKIKAHELHRHDDPLDHDFDDKLPKILVHPAILATGTHAGDRYEARPQVWAKAVVWLDL